MIVIKIIFWICLGLAAYTYVGYGVLLTVYNRIRRKFDCRNHEYDHYFEPAATLIIAAYNEGDCLEGKVKNCLELDYPADKLDILFVTDGSTDGSPDIIRRYPRLKVLHQPGRLGKTAAMNRAMQQVHTPVAIFCDANTMLNKDSVRRIVRHYADPRVGGVAGEKRIAAASDDTIAGRGEGAYWKYESWLKRMDSDFYSVVGAAGELFSLRTDLYEFPGNDIILDDFVLSMQVALRGYRVMYEPEAYAMELPSGDLREERKRKIRISAGAFQAMGRLKGAFNIVKRPRLAFQFISHRVFRWTVTPVCLLLALILNIVLVIYGHHPVYHYMLIFQGSFYLSAGLGYLFSLRNKQLKLLYIPYYFIFMNFSVFCGFRRYKLGRQTVAWEKAKRKNNLG